MASQTFVQQPYAAAAEDDGGPMTSDGRGPGMSPSTFQEAQAERERQSKMRPASADRARSMLGAVGQFGAQACGAVWNTLGGGNAYQQQSAPPVQPPWNPMGFGSPHMDHMRWL